MNHYNYNNINIITPVRGDCSFLIEATLVLQTLIVKPTEVGTVGYELLHNQFIHDRINHKVTVINRIKFSQLYHLGDFVELAKERIMNRNITVDKIELYNLKHEGDGERYRVQHLGELKHIDDIYDEEVMPNDGYCFDNYRLFVPGLYFKDSSLAECQLLDSLHY